VSLSRRAFVGALAALAGGCQGAAARPSRTSASHASEDFDVVDLSHSLGRLPARNARLFVGPPKVEAASGSPARVIAWVPRLGENR